MEYIAHIDKDEKIQTVKEHSLNVAKQCEDILSEINLSSTGKLIGILHDSGKYSDLFQNYIRDENGVRGSVRHTFSAPKYLMDARDKADDDYTKLALEVASSVISSHHGLVDNIRDDGAMEVIRRQTLQEETENSAQSISRLLADCISEQEIQKLIEKSTEEIKSYYNSFKDPSHLSSLYLYLCSALIDADRRDTAEFMYDFRYPKYNPDWKNCGEVILNRLNSFNSDTEINKCRREMSDFCFDFAKTSNGIYKLLLMVGAGKTLSSLRYAVEHCKLYNKKRIIYCAPYLSVVDQNAREVQGLLGDKIKILEHHSNRVLEHGKEKFQYHIDTDSWDAPIIITTTVQLLEILTAKDTEHVRKFHSLYDSVIIIDEAQSIPTKLISIFNTQCNFLKEYCKTDIILCSATIPTFDCTDHPLNIDNVDIIPKDKMDYYKEVFHRTDLIDGGTMALEEVAPFIEEQLNSVKSFLAIFNTKREALTVFRSIKRTDIIKYHLTANMCAKQRLEIIDEIKSNLKAGFKVLCVSTQVIEAGVDISFECGLRALAGLDRGIQSGGRVNRSGEFGHVCNLYMIDLSNQKLGNSLKEIAISQKVMTSTKKQFPGNRLTSDNAIRYYFQQFLKHDGINLNYAEEIDSQPVELYDLFAGYGKYYNNNNLLENMGDCVLAQKFKTVSEHINILDTDSVPVIVPYKEGAEIIEELKSEKALNDMKYRCSLLDKSKLYIVNIHCKNWEQLRELGAVEYLFEDTVAVLASPSFYDSTVGILMPDEIERQILIM